MNGPAHPIDLCQDQLAGIEFHLLRIIAATLRDDAGAQLVHAALRAQAQERVAQASELLRQAHPLVRPYGVLIQWTRQTDHGGIRAAPSVAALRATCALLYAAALELDQCVPGGTVRAG